MQYRESAGFLLRFEPLIESEAVIDIPCDASGQVDLDALTEADRNAYFYARSVRRGRFAACVVPLHGGRKSSDSFRERHATVKP